MSKRDEERSGIDYLNPIDFGRYVTPTYGDSWGGLWNSGKAATIKPLAGKGLNDMAARAGVEPQAIMDANPNYDWANVGANGSPIIQKGATFNTGKTGGGSINLAGAQAWMGLAASLYGANLARQQLKLGKQELAFNKDKYYQDRADFKETQAFNRTASADAYAARGDGWRANKLVDQWGANKGQHYGSGTSALATA